MARSDGDTWDLASGVGATATAVATSRALATRIGLIEDRWAEPLVRAVGAEHFLGILQHPDGLPDQQRMTMGMAVRTRFFDDFLARAVISLRISPDSRSDARRKDRRDPRGPRSVPTHGSCD